MLGISQAHAIEPVSTIGFVIATFTAGRAVEQAKDHPTYNCYKDAMWKGAGYVVEAQCREIESNPNLIAVK